MSQIFVGSEEVRGNHIKKKISLSLLIYIYLDCVKGQLISKGLFGVFNSSIKQTKTSRPEVS